MLLRLRHGLISFSEKKVMEKTSAQKTKTQAPAGYSTVCPYLVVPSVETTLEFLENVFHADVKDSFKGKSGMVVHGEARIGDTVIMIGRANEKWPAQTCMLYVYVDQVEETYQRALQFGATSVMEPKDQFYGNREAGVKDSQGNTWWIARQVEEVSAEELQRRLLEMDM